MSDRQYRDQIEAIIDDLVNDHPGEGPRWSDDDHLPPPAPPKLMKLRITSGADEPMRSFSDVTGSALVSPTTFRIETLDGVIRLFDMSGRDFTLIPQGEVVPGV